MQQLLTFRAGRQQHVTRAVLGTPEIREQLLLKILLFPFCEILQAPIGSKPPDAMALRSLTSSPVPGTVSVRGGRGQLPAELLAAAVLEKRPKALALLSWVGNQHLSKK